MVEMSEIVSDREHKATQVMKKFYDKSAKVKSFSVGEMVLVRKLGLTVSWEILGRAHTR